ncbi:MAG: beta-N-acetylhexosaminidase [Bacteroidales bacterium]|nr:beta-N-acetylhexosaminidase [Bacteroidales bacterium]
MVKTTNFIIRCLILLLLVVNFNACKEEKPDEQTSIIKPQNIIPAPEKIILSDDHVNISAETVLYSDVRFQKAKDIIVKAINDAGFFTLNQFSTSQDNSDILILYSENLADDEYHIEIDSGKIIITAKSPQSAFYAAQTFKQILWTAELDSAENAIKVQAISINDKPQNKYRGFHIDLSRHFFPKEFVFKLIDQMAFYKMNKLQLHLTDDQGWRIQIDKYPKLTSVGAYRTFNDQDSVCMEKAKYDADYNFNPQFVNGSTYGGFYTKQDLQDIITYAKDNFIDIIPEIDMPGHMSAAIRSYPELSLSCSGNTNWGNEFSEPLCVCRNDVMQFCYNVWDEVMELFPYEYVHLGADEVEKSFWEQSSDCQQFMQDNNMNHINQIQSYFVDKMFEHISSKGKKMIAWDDIFVSNDDNIVNQVDPAITIMYWRDYKPESADYAAQNGNDIVLTPWSWFYLSSDPTDENLKSLYEFSEQSELSEQVIAKKIGYQACVWTEEIPSEAVFERYIYPRFQAYAEVAWSKNKVWDSFIKRMPAHINYLKENSIKYTESSYFK